GSVTFLDRRGCPSFEEGILPYSRLFQFIHTVYDRAYNLMKSFLRTVLSLSVVHWLTSVGVVLTTGSAAVFLILLFQQFENPYVGIIVFLIIPAIFVLGLILMPIGLI